MNSYFRFKKFTVYQEKCAMKVGTDGVLLGAWVDVSSAGRILDLGTGSGIIALLCAQRSSSALIDAIEVDKDASAQAGDNFMLSPWSDRLKNINVSFQNYARETHFRYDVIISNPPFFRNSLKPPDKTRSMARHDNDLTLETLFHYSVRLLNPKGKITLIFPANDIEFALTTAYFSGMHPARITLIRPVEGKDFTRCLIEFTRNENDHLIKDEIFIKNAGNEYTDVFRELTREFYLNF